MLTFLLGHIILIGLEDVQWTYAEVLVDLNDWVQLLISDTAWQSHLRRCLPLVSRTFLGRELE